LQIAVETVSIVPSSLVPTADSNSLPFERRFPEYEEAAFEEVVGVDAYSLEQAEQFSRLAPIRFCTLPEFYLIEAAADYLPKDYLEEFPSYEVRKTRAQSSFQNYYGHLRDLVVGTALRKGVSQPEEIPTEWGNFFDDVDLEGHSLVSYTKEAFTESIDGGVSGIWVEYPKLPPDLTSDEEKKINARPYFVLMRVDQVLECRYDQFTVDLGGQSVFGAFPTYLRIKTEVRQQSETNEFFEEVVPAVRVYDIQSASTDTVSQFGDSIGGTSPNQRVRCRLYTKKISQESIDKYILSETSYISLPFIPFVPIFGGKKEAFFRARPLLFDIARLNLHHWSVSADLAESIHLTASPILTGTGVRPEDKIEAGGGRALFSSNSDAKYGMLSAPMDGASITLENLKRIESAMERLAAVAMTTGKTQSESGFAKLLDRSQSDSLLAVLVQSLEDSINRALLYASAYRKIPPVRISISKNFIPVKLHSQQVLALLALLKSNTITIELFLQMLEAGEMFEGLANFSVKELLGKMNLEGNETAEDLGIADGASTQTPNRGQIPVDASTPLSEGSDAETGETSVEPTESDGAMI
jgi:hypothetical protein